MNESHQRQQLEAALVAYIKGKLPEFSKADDCNTSFSRLGLDSLGHVEISSVIEDSLGVKVDPEVAFNYPTLNALVEFVVTTFAAAPAGGEAADGANA